MTNEKSTLKIDKTIHYLLISLSTFILSYNMFSNNTGNHVSSYLPKRKKVHGTWKSGKFCFIYQASNDFSVIDLVPPKNVVHCSYFEYNTVSDDQI